MAIKTLWSLQKIKVSRESGNTTFIFLGLNIYIYIKRTSVSGCITTFVYMYTFTSYGLLMMYSYKEVYKSDL